MLRFIAALSLALIVMGLPAWAGPDEDCNQNQDQQRSINGCTEQIRENPRDAIAYNNRGVAYQAKGDFDRAIADFDKAIEIDPKNATPYSNRGYAYRRDDPDRAIADFNKAIEINPKYSPAYTGRGEAYEYKGDPDRAVADYNSTISINPKYAPAYTRRGELYRTKGDIDRAIADYSKSLEINPTNLDAQSFRGLAYQAKGDFDRAIADFDKAIEIDPTILFLYTNRGDAYQAKGDFDRAVVDYSKAIEILPTDALARNNRGRAYQAKGNLDRAIADFNEVIEKHPKYAWAYSNRGVAYKAKGDLDRALIDLSKAVDLDLASVNGDNPFHFTSDPEIFAARASVYEAKGLFERAIIDYKVAVILPANTYWQRRAVNEARTRLAALERQTQGHGQRAVKRIALLIGNKDYKPGVGALVNPLNDIRIVGNALKAIGFEVLTPALNAKRADMLTAIYGFAHKLKTAGSDAVGFLYYSGHGIASAGENYLIPVDIEEPSTIQLSVQGVKQSEVLAILRNEAPNAAHYLVLDACRNTLQGARGGKGFVPIGQQSGVLVAFAAEPGKTASDTGPGSGPYASALAAELVKPGQNDLLMFHRVRVDVMDKTGGDQVPWTEDGIQRRERVTFGPVGR